ncbi:MAG TPA: BTAD domain-containing putative transcriptional regulator, partial [Acidimicrobiales bacterium]|nr:BTAD domain-containing putative transcriptional regulator [Acidimicrobiales bacterium]
MQVQLLGPLELVDGDGALVGIGGPKERALLAILAIHANRTVSEDRLVDALWGDEPPRTATRTLQSHLSRLRKVLVDAARPPDKGDVVLESGPAGWILRLARDALDITRVEALVADGRAAAARRDHLGAALAFADSLRPWRGRPLDEFADQPWAALESRRLEEVHQLIVEERVDAELACGRHAELVGELSAICRTHPLRERPWGQRMLALYRSGRQADALRVCQELRHTLAEELGIDPSPAIIRLEQAILTQDPTLELEAASPAVSVLTGQVSTSASGVVALLFTDIVASTELLGRLGDDDYDQLRRDHIRMLRDSIAAAGGAEVKNLGDGLMVVFSGAVDALSCAVSIQQAVAKHNRRAGERGLAVRVGLHAGEAVRDDGDYFGTPVVVAKRLCDAAGPGEIVASQLVRELVGSRGGFEFVELERLELKGLGAPVAACRLAWVEQATRPLPTTLANLREAAFVGREREIGELEAAWRRAQQGRREVVLVAGEPGIGKTTLAVHLAHVAWQAGAVVLFGRCDEESIVPFQPFVESVSQYVDSTPPDHLRAQLGAQAADLALLLPGIARQLPELVGIAGTGAETERYRIFEAIAGLFATIGNESPIVLLLDDLHWADRPTLQLLQHLIRRGADLPLLIVGTYRDTDLVRTHPMAETLVDLRRANLVARIPLRGLSSDDVLSLIAGDNDPMPADKELAEALWQETEGSPLFLREILRHLAETGGVSRTDDGRWEARRRIDQLAIPEGVKEVIGRRLTRLSEAANTALRAGSVLGRELRFDVLELLAGLTTDELLDALDEATAAGVIDELPGGAGRWSFTHALVRQALYEELSLTRRVRQHQHAGEALEALHGDEAGPHLAEIAFHLSQGAVAGGAAGADRAIRYATLAAEYALTLAAYEEAARHFAMAVEVAEDAGLDPLRRADLLLAQGDSEWRSSDDRVARATFERVVSLVGTRDAERLARAALGYAGAELRPVWVQVGMVNERVITLLETALDLLPERDSELRARVLACLAQELYFLSDAEPRRTHLSTMAVEMARRLGDAGTIAYTLAARNLATMGPDTAEEMVANASDMLAIAEALSDRQLEAHALRHRLLGYLAMNDVTRASADLQRWFALIEDLKDPVAAGIAVSFRGGLATLEGRFDLAETLLQESFRRTHEARDPNSFGVAGVPMGFLRLLQGRSAELLSTIEAAAEVYPAMAGWVNAALAALYAEVGKDAEAHAYLELVEPLDAQSMPRNLFWLVGLTLLARTTFRLRDRNRAEAIYQLALPYADCNAGAATASLGSMQQTLAWAATAAGRLEEAEHHFEAAIADNRRKGWRPWVADSQLHYASMLAGRDRPGDCVKALDLLDGALTTMSELGMPALEQEATALRDRLLGAGQEDAKELRGQRTVRRVDRAKAKLTARGRAAVARWTRSDDDDDLVRKFG